MTLGLVAATKEARQWCPAIAGSQAPAWEPMFSSSSLPWRLNQSFKDRIPKLELGNE